MKNFSGALKTLKKQDIAPDARLWTRIEETLERPPVFPVRRLAYSAALLTVFGLAVLAGGNYYEEYRLDKYLAQSWQHAYYAEAFGAFI
ncbi:MAG: hypothetical protein LBD99_00625 [Candidatus Margulisbacteria bacterium]|jgi:hypothetical protein|nr:hypothetical protein [Candidatus Margulisiibacteriota bacterium]